MFFFDLLVNSLVLSWFYIGVCWEFLVLVCAFNNNYHVCIYPPMWASGPANGPPFIHQFEPKFDWWAAFHSWVWAQHFFPSSLPIWDLCNILSTSYLSFGKIDVIQFMNVCRLTKVNKGIYTNEILKPSTWGASMFFRSKSFENVTLWSLFIIQILHPNFLTQNRTLFIVKKKKKKRKNNRTIF